MNRDAVERAATGSGRVTSMTRDEHRVAREFVSFMRILRGDVRELRARFRASVLLQNQAALSPPRPLFPSAGKRGSFVWISVTSTMQ